MASSTGLLNPLRRRSMPMPLSFFELRIVLLGTDVRYTNKLANILLGREAFQTEAPYLLAQHCERVSGQVEGRTITIINAPQLYNPEFSQEEVIQKVKACLTLSDPGPHVFLLVLQFQTFTQEQNDRIIRTLNSYIPQSIKRLLLVTPAEEHGFFSTCISECEMKHFRIVNLSEFNKQHVLKLLNTIDGIVTENGDHLEIPRPQDQDYSFESASSAAYAQRKQLVTSRAHEEVSALSVLNLMLCGSDELKSSISDLILKQTEQISDPRSEFVMRTGVVSGYRVTLVETPTLSNTQLSEEEVRRETLQCVSVCNPGVHAFIIIIPVGPLKDEDKAEIKIIQKIFSSRMNDHTLVLFINSNSEETAAMNFIKQSSDTEELLRIWSGRYIMLQKTESERIKQVPALLDQIKRMEATNMFYSLLMYFEAQRDEAKQELEKKLAEKEKRIKELEKHQTHAEGDSPDPGSLRIVLIGKTGNGKSTSGNTILGKEEFQCNVLMTSETNICQKGFGEFQGKSVAVVDTPGLFDTTLSNKEVIEEIVKCIYLSAPGPHAFIIVLTIGRITNEELETLSLIKEMFGSEAARYTIVLFTHGDNLEDQTLQEYIHKSAHRSMDKLISDCGGRVHVFNNRKKKDRTQVYDLIKMIEEMIKFNRNNYFTNEMFEMAENSIQKKQQEILKKKEEQMQAETEALENKHEQELETVRKSMEKEKEMLEQERQERENMFREKEEALRREFKKKEEEEKEKRRVEDQKRADEEKRQKKENDRMLKEMRETMEKQNDKFLKIQAEKEEEDQRRAEGEKNKRESFEREQKEEMEKVKTRQQEEIKKRDDEEQQKRKQQEIEEENWKRKIKEAEHDKKEIKDIKRKLRGQEMEWEENMKAREEEQKRTKEKHEKEIKEQEEKQEQIKINFNKEREDERRKREQEIEEWKETERREREQREKEYEKHKLKMEKEYEELERFRKEEWERRTSEDNERREAESQRIKRLKEEIERDRQEEKNRREKEDRDRKEKEEREREEMKKNYEKKELEMKNKYEDEARRQAEVLSDVRAQLENRIEELIIKHQREFELLNELFQGSEKEHEKLKLSKEDIERTLHEEIEKLKMSKEKTDHKSGEENKQKDRCNIL